jgi:hypothetical protein
LRCARGGDAGSRLAALDDGPTAGCRLDMKKPPATNPTAAAARQIIKVFINLFGLRGDDRVTFGSGQVRNDLAWKLTPN